MTFVPFDIKTVPETNEEKEFDAIYWGGVHGEDHKLILEAISKFKYNFFTLGPQEWCGSKEPKYYKYITHMNVPRAEMWEILRKTKINVCVNLIHLNDEQKRNIKAISRWEENRAFSHIDEGIIPQEFIYYDDNDELEEKIKHILENWSDYEHIIENAFNKAIGSYTVEKLVEQMAGGIKK